MSRPNALTVDFSTSRQTSLLPTGQFLVWAGHFPVKQIPYLEEKVPKISIDWPIPRDKQRQLWSVHCLTTLAMISSFWKMMIRIGSLYWIIDSARFHSKLPVMVRYWPKFIDFKCQLHWQGCYYFDHLFSREMEEVVFECILVTVMLSVILLGIWHWISFSCLRESFQGKLFLTPSTQLYLSSQRLINETNQPSLHLTRLYSQAARCWINSKIP